MNLLNVSSAMRYLLLLLPAILFSCSPPVVPETRPDQLAKSLCACTAALLALNKQAQTSSDSLAFRNIANEFEKTRDCVDKMGIKAEDRVALEIALQAHCPALAKQQDLLSELLEELAKD